MRAETFLSMYRVLEGMLDRKYAGRENGSSSVVISTIVAIALNLILPPDPPEEVEKTAVAFETDDVMERLSDDDPTNDPTDAEFQR